MQMNTGKKFLAKIRAGVRHKCAAAAAAAAATAALMVVENAAIR